MRHLEREVGHGEHLFLEVFLHAQTMLRSDTTSTNLAKPEAADDADKMRIQILNQVLVFTGIGIGETVILTDGPTLRMAQPRLHLAEVFDWLLRLFLLHLDFEGREGCIVFA